MYRAPDPNRAKVLRGTILTTLYYGEYSHPVNPDDPTLIGKNVLCITLENMGSLPGDDELHALLRYLEQKDYIKVNWRTDGSGTFDSLRLRPLGTDLVERSITDNGVMFARRRG